MATTSLIVLNGDGEKLREMLKGVRTIVDGVVPAGTFELVRADVFPIGQSPRGQTVKQRLSGLDENIRVRRAK